ncbi:MAG: hypothetical protein HOJ90_13570 [Alphaproteobacteria bacterium]|jgi:hypothetical protein|nr:hypothetical protein [Alphaproteobacteria bacterium]
MKTANQDTATQVTANLDTRVLTSSELNATIHAAEQLRSETIYQAIASTFRFLRQGTARLFAVEYQRPA